MDDFNHFKFNFVSVNIDTNLEEMYHQLCRTNWTWNTEAADKMWHFHIKISTRFIFNRIHSCTAYCFHIFHSLCVKSEINRLQRSPRGVSIDIACSRTLIEGATDCLQDSNSFTKPHTPGRIHNWGLVFYFTATKLWWFVKITIFVVSLREHFQDCGQMVDTAKNVLTRWQLSGQT